MGKVEYKVDIVVEYIGEPSHLVEYIGEPFHLVEYLGEPVVSVDLSSAEVLVRVM